MDTYFNSAQALLILYPYNTPGNGGFDMMNFSATQLKRIVQTDHDLDIVLYYE